MSELPTTPDPGDPRDAPFPFASDASPTPPPGWYADPSNPGGQRWWDGRQWGQAAAPSMPVAPPYDPAARAADERNLAVLAQVLGIFTSFLGPLIIYLIARPDQPYAKHHAAEALNFSITVIIGYVVSAVLMLVLIGFLLFFVVWIAAIVLGIVAAVAASKGEWYRYPINIRMVPGAYG